MDEPAAGASWLPTGQVAERGERYVVVEAVMVRRRSLLVLRLARRALLPWLPIWNLSRLLTLGSAAQQLHRAVDVDDDFRGIALDAVLLPLAGLQLALDVALGALAQVLAGDLGDLPE